MQQDRNWIVLLGVIGVTEIAASLETTMMFAALPAAMREIGRPHEVIWLVTAYLVVAAGSAAVCGRLGDMFGRKRMIVALLAITGCASVLSAVATDLHWIIAGRAIQGLAGAIMPLGYGLAREHLPPDKLGLGTGVITGIASISTGGAFIIGGLVVDHAHWQHIFTVTAILAFLAAGLCWVTLPKSAATGERQDLDLLGGLLFMPSVGMLLLALSLMEKSHGSIPLALMVGGIAGLGLWWRHEWLHSRPLLDVRLLVNRDILFTNATCACLGLGTLQMLLLFPLILQQPAWTGIGFGLGAALTGVLKLPSNVVTVTGAIVAGACAGRYGGRIVVIAGCAISLFFWAALWSYQGNLWLVLLFIGLAGAGGTVVLTGMANVLMANVPSDRTSEATGMNIVVRKIAQAFGAQILGLLLATSVVTGTDGLTYSTHAAFSYAVLFVAGISALGVFCACMIRRSEPVAPPAAVLTSSGT